MITNRHEHEPLYTAKELAKLIKVSTRTVELWSAAGVIPALRPKGTRTVRYKYSAVLEALEGKSAVTAANSEEEGGSDA